MRVNESPGYLKCACVHCAGRIEFPAEMAGMAIACPHCHFQTALAAPTEPPVPRAPRERRVRKRVLLPVTFAVLVSAAFLFVLAGRGSLFVRELKCDRATPNSAGAVSGVVQNKSSRPRRNVRVEINLLNSRGETLWQATGHAAEIPARGTWEFRTLVLDPAVVTGKVARIRAN